MSSVLPPLRLRLINEMIKLCDWLATLPDYAVCAIGGLVAVLIDCANYNPQGRRLRLINGLGVELCNIL